MRSLLVVDDEMDIRELLRTAFTREGYEVVTVPHVDQALEALSKRPFDLVILDIRFPDESGASLVRRMRDSQNTTPVVVYSATVSTEDESQLRAFGVSDIVLKSSGIFPLVESVQKALHTRKSSSAQPSARLALVVDDDKSVRMVLCRFLESRHFTVHQADSGRSAVDAVRAQAFTVVFLDVNMPGEIDGIGALQEIRTVRPEQAVIMVTGEQDDRTVGRAVELGAAGYVVKPFDFLYLEMMLVSKLDNQRR